MEAMQPLGGLVDGYLYGGWIDLQGTDCEHESDG